MTLGPVFIDIASITLSKKDRVLLRHPMVGGVVLFARNYHCKSQLKKLVNEIHGLRSPPLSVATDHEGGRVQRFIEGFTRLPAPVCLGRLFDRSPEKALALANASGWLTGTELSSVGVDLVLAPVVDLLGGTSPVIGDRAWHADPAIVADLTWAYIQGVEEAGVSAVAKHFPGHGQAPGDSHHWSAVDERSWPELISTDTQAFARLVDRGVRALMVGHVTYPAVDECPASRSKIWLNDVLRKELGFQGHIFSDDLAMAGARGPKRYADRISAALGAGCDWVLLGQGKFERVCHLGASTLSESKSRRHRQPPGPHVARVEIDPQRLLEVARALVELGDGSD